tara:strand:- start:263 stop:397 length:135 start_codon:yes stop_codon:yes gene_type:complete
LTDEEKQTIREENRKIREEQNQNSKKELDAKYPDKDLDKINLMV